MYVCSMSQVAIYTHTYTHTHTPVHTHTHTHTHTHILTFIHILHAYTHTYSHSYISYMHTHIHTRVCQRILQAGAFLIISRDNSGGHCVLSINKYSMISLADASVCAVNWTQSSVYTVYMCVCSQLNTWLSVHGVRLCVQSTEHKAQCTRYPANS